VTCRGFNTVNLHVARLIFGLRSLDSWWSLDDAANGLDAQLWCGRGPGVRVAQRYMHTLGQGASSPLNGTAGASRACCWSLLAPPVECTQLQCLLFCRGQVVPSNHRGLFKKPKSFQDYTSHQNLRHIHKALNIDENKN